MGIDHEFLEEVFTKQPGKYIAFSAKLPNGRWIDRFFLSVEKAIRWAEKQPEGADLYFCPTKLKDRRRVKANVAPSRFLYSDLDEADPTRFEPHLRPSHAWESSPGRFQALWELTDEAEPKDVEGKNKGLAYKLGGDRGGWDLTQVLRIPGTHNYKYEDAPEVRTLWVRPEPKSLESYPSAPNGHDKSEHERLSAESVDLNKLLNKWRRRIPRKALNLLLSKQAERGKRSDVLWYLSHILVESGVSSEEAFALIRASVWNKYRGRSDEIERLSHEIGEAREEVDGAQSSGDDGSEETVPSEALRSTLAITSHADLMANPSASPGWLVDKFWTRESHGIIAGEPKSFKSTLLLDFVVSIASGEPFLGEFEVKESGPVLVVQNENSDWIMQDRLNKITSRKGIRGTSRKQKDGSMLITAPIELPIYYMNQQGFLMSDPSHQEQLEDFVRRARPLAVIFDPLYLMFDGDVNSAKDLGPALSWLLYLKQEYSTSIMLVHHWGKNKQSKRGGQRMLGSTTLHGWIESAWYIAVQGPIEEEEPDDDIHKQASDMLLTLEREFRGAGTYPKVDITIGMGDFGSRRYHTSVEKHSELGRPKKDRNVILGDVLSYMETTERSLSVKDLSEETGLSRRIISETIGNLLDNKKISKDGRKYKLVR